MKKVVFAVIGLVSMAACNQGENEKLTRRNDSLAFVLDEKIAILNERDSSLNNFVSAFNEIEANLDSVAARQKIVSSYAGGDKNELNKDRKANINAQIEAINELMIKNRKQIAQLSKNLKNSKEKNVLLEKTIETLTAQIAQKDTELAELNSKLTSSNAQVLTLSTRVDSLSEQNVAKTGTINSQIAKMHTAYYRVGELKTLKEEKVIEQKGGVLGIAKTAVLSKDFDTTKFTNIDYTKVTKIPVNGSDVKIITNHPSGSYTLVQDGEKGKVTDLTVTNPEVFWSRSNYLVITKK
jgi:uncharacterized coiled-coil protein SlyX